MSKGLAHGVWLRGQRAWRRRSLWTLLVALVAATLVTLVWLAGRYEASVVQAQVDRDVALAAADIRAALARNLQSLQALQTRGHDVDTWEAHAQALLREHRELLRIEWRTVALDTHAQVESPFWPIAWDRSARTDLRSDSAAACANAHRLGGAAYSDSRFQPHGDGQGSEVMEVCLSLFAAGRDAGYTVATYSLSGILGELVGHNLTRRQEISFTEVDGARLAVIGAAQRGTRLFSAQTLLNLPGNTLVLRMGRWHAAPSLFPNVLTALVTAMSIALVTVLAVLVRDNRRRLRAERDLGDALAFRKAMEDSLLTGLRARDLQGGITYVNPAFCDMVGFGAPELLGQSGPAPYWPPEVAQEYWDRQLLRRAETAPPREGFESIFMRKNGTRFPVLIIEAPLINALGKHTGWMSACIDISEQRRVEELSRASQERLQATARLATVGEMASLLSHELNQPLAAISSYATGTLNLLGPPPPEGAAPVPQDWSDVRTALQRIAHQAERAGRVIKSVHDFVRRRDQAHEAVPAQELLGDVLPLVHLQARKLGVRVQVSIDAGLPPVRCDRTMVEQVLLNLTRNAMQAMDDASIGVRVLDIRVRLAASNARNSWVAFSVGDCGVGMPQETVQQLFTPFFTTRAEGMGLGLSLCRTVVEQHGGELEFAANPGRGTVFTFTLPADLHRPPAP